MVWVSGSWLPAFVFLLGVSPLSLGCGCGFPSRLVGWGCLPCLACWLGLPIACRSCGCAMVRSALPLLMPAALAVCGGVGVWRGVCGVCCGCVVWVCGVRV